MSDEPEDTKPAAEEKEEGAALVPDAPATEEKKPEESSPKRNAELDKKSSQRGSRMMGALIGQLNKAKTGMQQERTSVGVKKKEEALVRAEEKIATQCREASEKQREAFAKFAEEMKGKKGSGGFGKGGGGGMAGWLGKGKGPGFMGGRDERDTPRGRDDRDRDRDDRRSTRDERDRRPA